MPRPRNRLHAVDFLVLGVAVFLIAVALPLFRDMSVPWTPGSGTESVSTDPRELPYFAARTTLRMFLGLAASILFTLVVGQWAAHSRRAEKVLVPMVDVLQSVPVLALVSITVTAFVALFLGSFLGAEAVCVFAIFTAMAWNMTFAYYQAVRTLPRELDDAARILRLTRWQRLWQLEAMDDLGVHGWLRWKSLILPAIAPGNVVGAITAFGGAWNATLVGEAVEAGGTHPPAGVRAGRLHHQCHRGGRVSEGAAGHRGDECRHRDHQPAGVASATAPGGTAFLVELKQFSKGGQLSPRGGRGRGVCLRAWPAPAPPGWCGPRR
ncbi:ABC transporter permease subunit [Nocardia sp. NPDC005746]|uniref:ABC transporter permease subunit n=1 Tax=Nocardia sp. NPDC005746 TaxID=3157062 RepID=UPI0033F45CF9